MKTVKINSKRGEDLLQAYIIMHWGSPKVKVNDTQNLANAKQAAQSLGLIYSDDVELKNAFNNAYLHVRNMQTADYDQWHRLKEAIKIQTDINSKGIDLLKTVPELLGGITSFDFKRIWNAVKNLPRMAVDGWTLEDKAIQHAGQTMRGVDLERDQDNEKAVKAAQASATQNVESYLQEKQQEHEVMQQAAKKIAAMNPKSGLFKALAKPAQRRALNAKTTKTSKDTVDLIREEREQNGEKLTKGELIALSKQRNARIKGGNHPEWYGKYPELLPNNLNYAVRKEYSGFNMAIGARVWTNLVIPQKDGKVSQAYKDAIRAIYIKLRGSNNGAFNYDDEDVAAYLEVARGIFAFYYNLHRDIRLVNNLDPYISKTPEPIAALAGYNSTAYTDLVQNRANYFIRLNHLAHKIGITLPVPPDMSVFDRDKYVASAIIEEGKGPKSSLFMYVLGQITTTVVNDHTLTVVDTQIGQPFSTRLQVLETAINAIYNYSNPLYGGQTLVKVAGDMIKAYGEGAFKQLPLVSEADKAEVLRDDYLLNQIQNNNVAQLCSNFTNSSDDTAYNMTYDVDVNINGTNSYTIKKENIHGDVANEAHCFLINRSSANITNLESVSLTRGNFTFEDDAFKTGSSATVGVKDTGTDVICNVYYYYYDASGNISGQQFSLAASGETLNPNVASLWSQVDYSPLITIYPANDTAYYILDLDTYAFCSLAQFKIMNDAAVMSEYKTVGIQAQANFRSVKRK